MSPNKRMAQKLPSMALDSGIPAGMTSFGYSHRLVYNDERSGVGIPPVTLQRHATLERCRMNSHAGAWELFEDSFYRFTT
jgi:hypothetical protein